MGNRYWISGAQIGMLLAFNECGKKLETKKLLDDIQKKQEIDLRNKMSFEDVMGEVIR